MNEEKWTIYDLAKQAPERAIKQTLDLVDIYKDEAEQLKQRCEDYKTLLIDQENAHRKDRRKLEKAEELIINFKNVFSVMMEAMEEEAEFSVCIADYEIASYLNKISDYFNGQIKLALTAEKEPEKQDDNCHNPI